MALFNIYCLRDPRDNAIRYIGKTNGLLCDRLKVHIHQSKKVIKPTHKEAWIKQLLFKGLRPNIELLDSVPEESWKEWETAFIRSGKDLGLRLTNLSNGGDGHGRFKHTEEHKERLRQMMKGNKYGVGRKLTPEQYDRWRTAMAKQGKPKGMTGKTHTEEWKKKSSERMKGEKHPMSKLTDKQRQELRERRKMGEKVIDLAKEFKINYRHMCSIVSPKNLIAA